MAVELPDGELATWRRRIAAAKADRKRFEPLWQMCLAFAAGKHHLEWRGTRLARQLYLPQLKPGQHRYTVDEISPMRMAALGELAMDDDRPQILFGPDDLPDEEYAKSFNDAIGAGWQAEWAGDRVMQDIRRTIIDVGTAVARCRFDPTAGGTLARDVPHQDGKPLLDPAKARDYVAAQQAAGQSAGLRTIHEGAIRWDAGTPFNMLVPPGIKREHKFPWEGWVEPVHVDKVLEEFGSNANGLKSERIDDVNSLSADANTDIPGSADPDADPGTPGKIEDHTFLYTVYDLPSRKYPKGRVLVFAGASLKLLQVRDQLDYRAPDGTWRSGLHYFHWIRLTDRFWSKGLVELIKDSNRAIDKRRSQVGETIDRGQPFILADERAVPRRTGVPVEIIKLKTGNFPAPTVSSGVPPGPWMKDEVVSLREDMQRASGMQDVLQGQNPQNVGNYSQLALLQEQASRKFDPIVSDFKKTEARLVEDTCWDIRRYWGPEKKLSAVGPDGQLERITLDATKMPDFYRVYIPSGASKPRSQAAELKKVDDIATLAINSGAVQQDPMAWVQWVKASYDAGKAVELPQAARHDQLDKALLENDLLAQGGMPAVAYYDDHALHVQVARSLQARADVSDDHDLAARCERHVQAHEQAAQQAAQIQAEHAAAQVAQGAAADGGGGVIPHPSAFSLFLRNGSGPGNFGI